jgi:putative colanic acid biosynthesis acetyltransferase WcaF
MMQLEKSQHRWSLSHKLLRVLWNVVWRTCGYYGPRGFSGWRVWLLKLFGAKIGRAPLICSRVQVLMPWNLTIGDCVALAERVDIYNFAPVAIGSNSCISQGVWLCTGTHDYRQPSFPLMWKPIAIGSSVWLASEVFVHPGVMIGDGVVVGARAVVNTDLSAWGVYSGNPCRFIKRRTLEGGE